MTMPRKFSVKALDQAEKLRIAGEKWAVIDAMLGAGITQACYYRRTQGYLGVYDEERETQNALMQWNGIGDRQSFIDGYKSRAKLDRTIPQIKTDMDATYTAGQTARLRYEDKQLCPYTNSTPVGRRMRGQWLAGWNDQDMTTDKDYETHSTD